MLTRFCSLAVLCCFVTALSHAAPRGFFQGPSLQFALGARSAHFDMNRADNTKVARDIEPLFGFNLGWNVTDHWGYEFLGHYATNGTQNSQEHLLHFAFGGRLNWINTTLTQSERLRIIPFITAGPALQINILPSTIQLSEARVTQLAGGIEGSVGTSVLFWHDHVHLSLRGSAGPLFYEEISRTISGANTQLYQGGWKWHWSSIVHLGAHF